MRYTGEVIRGRVSPLQDLLTVINGIKGNDLVRASNSLKTDGLLRIIEMDRRTLPAHLVKNMQKALSLNAFGFFNDEEKRKRVPPDIIEFSEQHQGLLRSATKSLRLLLDGRPALVSSFSTAPLHH